LKVLRFAIVGIILLLLGVWFGRSFNGNSKLKKEELPSATVLQVPIPLLSFSLTDHKGLPFTLDNLSRKWTFMFFGYTHCPDICPVALVDLNDVYHNLIEKGDLVEKEYKINTQVVFVTVDPQRDTVEQLKEYIPYFNKDFIGVTGEPEVIALLARLMGVAYRRVPGSDKEDDYLVDHTASFLLIDPLGRLRAIFPPPHDPKQIARDFRDIRKEFTAECCITPDEGLKSVIFDYREEKK
jgi:protein SCO1/2